LGKCGADQGFEFEGGENDVETELGEIVLVAMGDLFEQAVQTQALEGVGDLRGGAPGELAEVGH
jgi:hypothetical protein